MNYLEERISPFSPGKPADSEYFVGREIELNRILRSGYQVSKGKQESIYIAGDFGIGKSSLAYFAKEAMFDQFKLIGFHVYLGNVDSIEAMTEKIVECTLKELHRIKAIDRVRVYLGKYIKEFSFLGIKINTEALKHDIPSLSTDLVSFLTEVYMSLSTDYKGIVLILDDLNGIVKNPQFAFLIKSSIDTIATSRIDLPLFLILSGTESRRQTLISHHQSVARIFSVVDVGPLSEKETADFFVNSFQKVGFTIEEKSLIALVTNSKGIPRLMHEMGDGIFWYAKTKNIDNNTVNAGIKIAYYELGRKYFAPIKNIIGSHEHLSILTAIINNSQNMGDTIFFNKQRVINELNETDKLKIDNLLLKLKRNNAIQSDDQKDDWIFNDLLTFMYLKFELQNLDLRKNQ